MSHLSPTTASTPVPGPRRLLIVDSDDDGLFLLRHALRHEFPAVEIREFRDAESALAALEIHKVDAIVTDNRLPGLSGIEFVRRFRRRDRHTPVIMLTGASEKEREALDAGVTTFMAAGSWDEIRQQVRRTLDGADKFKGGDPVQKNDPDVQGGSAGPRGHPGRRGVMLPSSAESICLRDNLKATEAPTAKSDSTPAKPRTLFSILIADDDSDDRFLLEYRLRKAGVLNPLVIFRDGDELVDFLQNVEANGGNPCLLLLDLSMPVFDGFRVLAWLHERPRFRALPVAVITSSDRESDRQRVLDNGVSEYWQKFPKEAELTRIVRWASSRPFSL